MSYPGFEKVNAPGYPGNITIRMIACDYTGPLKIQIENHSNQWEFNFAVIQHTIGVKMVKVKDAGMSEFVAITDRKQYNVWSFFEIKENGYHKTLELPLTVQVISINDDIVEASIPEITIGKVFNAEGNFPIPKNRYFDIKTLQPKQKPIDAEPCCSLFHDDYDVMYKNGKTNGVYIGQFTSGSTVDYDYNQNPSEGSSCMKMEWKSSDIFLFVAVNPVRVDQYSDVHFKIKTSAKCDNCFKIKTYKSSEDGYDFSITKVNTWEEIIIPMDKLNITESTFDGIWLRNVDSVDKTVYLDDVYFVRKRDAPDTSVCYDGTIPSQDENNAFALIISMLALLLLILL